MSKNKGKDQAELKDIKPIVEWSHVAKSMRRPSWPMRQWQSPTCCKRGKYQTGFKEGTSTAAHVSRLIAQIHPGQGRKRRQYAALIDL